MPQYGTTALILFVLATCFYKKHVQEWKTFRVGVYSLLGAMALTPLARAIPASLQFSWAGQLLGAVASLAELLAFGAMILACLKKAELQAGLSCPGCGYTLKGLSEPRCPECGFRI